VYRPAAFGFPHIAERIRDSAGGRDFLTFSRWGNWREHTAIFQPWFTVALLAPLPMARIPEQVGDGVGRTTTGRKRGCRLEIFWTGGSRNTVFFRIWFAWDGVDISTLSVRWAAASGAGAARDDGRDFFAMQGIPFSDGGATFLKEKRASKAKSMCPVIVTNRLWRERFWQRSEYSGATGADGWKRAYTVGGSASPAGMARSVRGAIYLWPMALAGPIRSRHETAIGCSLMGTVLKAGDVYLIGQARADMNRVALDIAEAISEVEQRLGGVIIEPLKKTISRGRDTDQQVCGC